MTCSPTPASGASRGDVRLLGAVLAGGVGRRFGGDKTAAEVGGVPMIRRGVRALRSVCDEVVVVSSRPDTPTGDWETIPDLRPSRGPLAGIEAALLAIAGADPSSSPGGGSGGAGPEASTSRRSAPTRDGVVVLAADMPLVGEDTVRRLVDAYLTTDAGVEAVAAGRDGDPPYEPLCAVYSVRCAPVVSQLLDDGRSSARDLFAAVTGSVVDVGEGMSLNVNTPEDRVAAEAELQARMTGE